MDRNYNIIGPKLAVTRVTNTRKMMLVIDTGTLGIKLGLNFVKIIFITPALPLGVVFAPEMLGAG